MTRINTNVGALIGRNNLQRSNANLSQSLTRLSTGLRINTGKDDPAGLIASENLRSDITSIRKAISNTDRANQVIATADSSLGQVSSLLNDIRGLVTESANAGALSDEQIEANQLQVDSSLDALNRIAQTTTFQGRRLLDGSLDFLTTQGANSSNISNLQIDQANLGATGQVSVDVNVTQAATQANIEIGNLPDVTPPVTGAVTFAIETTAAVGSTGSVDFDIVTQDTAQATGTFDTSATGTVALTGSGGDVLTFTGPGDRSLSITITNATSVDGTADITFNGTAIAVELDGETLGTNVLASRIEAVLQGTAGFEDFTVSSDGTTNTGTQALSAFTTTGADTITVTAIEDGIADGLAGNDIDVVFVDGAGTANGVDSVAFDGSTITVTADITGGVGSDDIAAAIAAFNGGAVFASSSDGTGNLLATDAGRTIADVTSAGTDAITTTESIDITGTLVAGEDGDIAISFAEAALGASNPTTNVIGNATSGYTVQINTDTVGGVEIDDIRLAIASIAEVDTAAFTTAGTANYNLLQTNGTGDNAPEAPPATVTLANGVSQVITNEAINITTATGFIGNLSIGFAEANLSGTPTNLITNGTNDYTIQIDNSATVTLEQIRSTIAGLAEVATATFANASAGTRTYDATVDAPPTPPTLLTGAGAGNGVNGIDADLVFELAGSIGSEVLTFEANTSLELLVKGINAVSDATGVQAEANGTGDGLILSSTEYGSDSFVDVKIIAEGAGGAFTTELGSGSRVEGADIAASINGITANGDGNNLSINTATLDLSATITADFVGTASFSISGGGALFQLGPDVVSNQQARLGIRSVNTAALGGVSGLLYQLKDGGTASLANNPNTAAKIVGEAIDQVTSLRGRLGAFQRTTLETNKNALNDTLANLTEAESSIRDADFAEETANLTRSQILVQSGTRVLAIANQNPQNVLALLG